MMGWIKRILSWNESPTMKRAYGGGTSNFHDRNENKTRIRKRLTTSLLPRAVSFIVLILYCVAGAFIFIALEKEYQTTKSQALVKATEFLEDYRHLTIKKIIALKGILDRTNPEQVNRHKEVWKIKTVLDEYHAQITYTATVFGWDGAQTTEQLDDKWSVWRSILFCYTSITLVGYGKITPKTNYGRLLLIPYTLLGILIAMVFLMLLTSDLQWVMNVIYWRLGCFYVMKKRKETHKELEAPGVGALESKNDDFYGLEEEADEYGVIKYPGRLPWSYPLMYVVLFTLLFSVVFAQWEAEWSYLEAVYFLWTTITTIGFGDYVPGYSSHLSTSSGKWKIVVMMALVAVGLCIFATFFGGSRHEKEGQKEVTMYRDPTDGKYKLFVENGKGNMSEGIEAAQYSA